MEKQRVESGCKFSRRLLIIFISLFVFTSSLNAKNISSEEIKRLSFLVSSGQNLVTNTDVKFFLKIPSVNPIEVEILSTNEMENVEFISSRRIQMNETNEGTVVEVWYNFSKKGNYQLEPLVLRIQGRNYSINFEPIEIRFNPREQSPVVVVKFDDGLVLSSDKENFLQFQKDIENICFSKGSKIHFSVFIQYGIQLTSFNWEIPKDSIFKQVKTYSIIDEKYIENERNGELIPVSDFEWTPLKEGKMNFPQISMTVTSFTGYRSEIDFPVFSINIIPSELNTSEYQEDFFIDAFKEDNLHSPVETKIVITKEDCEKLAQMRIEERHSFLGFSRGKRADFEKKLEIRNNVNEFKLFYVYLILVLVIFSVFLFIFFLPKKKFFYNVITISVLTFSILLLIASILEVNKEHAVSKGCILYSIPEETAESKSDLLPGSYVEIKEKNGNWIYVNLGESGGWCKKDDFIIIK